MTKVLRIGATTCGAAGVALSICLATVTATATWAQQDGLVGDRSAVGWASDMAGPLDGADRDAALRAADGDTARALFGVLARQGCRVNPRTMQEVLAPEGFGYREVSDLLTDLVVNGVAAMDAAGAIQIPVALCPPVEGAASPRQAVVDAFVAGGCTLDETALLDAVGGMDPARVTAVVGGLIDAGRITVDGREATLTGPGCDGAEDGDS